MRTGDSTRKLGPGGREGDLATMSQTSTSLSMSSKFSFSSKVGLILHTNIFYVQVLTDLLRFACRQSLLCQEAYQKGKRLETLAFAEEDSAACQEGKGHSGF